MNWSEGTTVRIGFWTVLLLSIFAWAPATFPGYWQSLDGYIPVFNAVQPSAIAAIATAPDLWRGTGSAAFLIAQPLIRLGADPLLAVRVSFILCFVLGGSGIYVWLSERLGDRGAGLAGVTYMLLPMFLATVYVRGSLADAIIIALLPLALAGLASYSQRNSPVGAAVAVLSILWMWRVQAGLAVFATVLLLVYALVVERERLAVLTVAVAGAAGLASLVPLWSISAESPQVFQDHFVQLFQLFGVTWQIAPSIAGWQDQYPFQLGFVAVIFGVMALWSWWIVTRPLLNPGLRRLLLFCAAGVLVLVTLSLEISGPFWFLTRADRLLTYPWQILLLAAPLLAMMAGALPVTLPDLHTPVYWSALLAVTVLASMPYLSADYTTIHPSPRPLAIVGDNHIVVLSARLVEFDAPPAAELTVTWQALRPENFDYNVFVQAIRGEETDAETGEQVVAQLDVQPLGGERPVTSWRPGEIFTETYRLELPAQSRVSPLRYYFGFYDWRDGRRLPVDGGIDDKMVLYGQ